MRRDILILGRSGSNFPRSRARRYGCVRPALPNMGCIKRGFGNCPRSASAQITDACCRICRALRWPPNRRNHRTDRDSQYCAYEYQKILLQSGSQVALSGKGTCWGNAVTAIFYKTLKSGLMLRQSWKTKRQADAALFQYINGFYNPRRKHSAL